MAGVNKVILLGNLGSDPEVRYLESGSVVASFNIATSEKYKGKDGNMIEQTEWHRIELWDNLAKIAEQYLKKGNSVYVEGKIRTEEWTDKEGIQRKGIRIRGTSITLVGGNNNNNASQENTGGYSAPAQQPRATPAPAPTPAPAELSNGGEDDLPF
jgi:single-strand DNA-binding protein